MSWKVQLAQVLKELRGWMSFDTTKPKCMMNTLFVFIESMKSQQEVKDIP